MHVKIKPGDPYMPQYDGWWVCTSMTSIEQAEQSGKPSARMFQLNKSAFITIGNPTGDARRAYWIYVWRPGVAQEINKFGPVSP